MGIAKRERGRAFAKRLISKAAVKFCASDTETRQAVNEKVLTRADTQTPETAGFEGNTVGFDSTQPKPVLHTAFPKSESDLLAFSVNFRSY